jgi:hypothetical protein
MNHAVRAEPDPLKAFEEFKGRAVAFESTDTGLTKVVLRTVENKRTNVTEPIIRLMPAAHDKTVAEIEALAKREGVTIRVSWPGRLILAPVFNPRCIHVIITEVQKPIASEPPVAGRFKVTDVEYEPSSAELAKRTSAPPAP